jgi:thioredoxin-dependent peroxiredoxin
MATITLQGHPINAIGELPPVGSPAPTFTLTKTDLSDASLSDYAGKRVILNIFPSLDTPICAMSVRRFNTEANNLVNTSVLCISRDLPFAQARFCGAEGLENVLTLSDFHATSFGRDYGVLITDSPLRDLFCRALIVIDEEGRVIHSQLVPEIAQEPDYDQALAALK